jgi:hypothetical protein
MNAPVTALVFAGLLLVVLGLFVAGNLGIVALGLASIFGGGLLQVLGDRVRQ